MWLWGWTRGSHGVAAGSPAAGAELGALSRQGGSRFRIFGRVWGRRRIRTGQGTQPEPWGTSGAAAPKRGVGGGSAGPAVSPGAQHPGVRGDPGCDRPHGHFLGPDRCSRCLDWFSWRTDGQTDTGDSRNVPKGLGQDEAPRHGTGGAGVTRLQRKGPIRGGFSLVPPPSPSPSPSSCQAGGEIWRRIWGTPCSWHRYCELPGAAPDSCPRQAAGG